MRERLEMLLDELQYLKKEGINSVYYEDDSLDQLKAVVKESIRDRVSVDLQPVDPEPSVSKVIQSSPSRDKKLNPFSPLPSDIEILEVKTATRKIEKFPKTLKNETKQKVQTQTPINSETTVCINLPIGDKQTQWNYVRARTENAFNDAILNKEAKAGSKIIFGSGSLDSDIFFCGDSPGIEENIEGIPFAGESGKLLTKIIQAMGLRKENVYLANIINWVLEAPAHLGERMPTQQELNASLPYLKAQIEIVKPKVIITLGATAVNGLLGPNKSRKMGDIRGQWFEFQNRSLMITFHPSYLIRNNTLRTKRLVWEDMLEVMTRLGLPISEKQLNFFK